MTNTSPRPSIDRDAIIRILSSNTPDAIEAVRRQAEQILLTHCGNKVYYRGLVEFSNQCACNCLYCGIRAENTSVRRYAMNEAEIIEAALWCARAGYGSMVLQSGERKDEPFIAFVENVVRRIKRETVSTDLPQGLGITLCVGEQTEATYRRFREAGAHRYLLRIETTNPALFARIHPAGQTLASRMQALEHLHTAGFQVGTGVMIGLPGQTLDMLADDVVFFHRFDIDMIGMGSYISHAATPMAGWPNPDWPPARAFQTALLMVAAVRISLKDVNIAATTALQAMDPVGREKGLQFGANVIMPQLTPTEHRGDYLLYENKPCIDEDKSECRRCLERRIQSVGRTLAINEWGDSRHFARRTAEA